MKKMKAWASGNFLLVWVLLCLSTIFVFSCDRITRTIERKKKPEVVQNLESIFIHERAYFGEFNTYSTSFKNMHFRPYQIRSHYSYFLPDQVIQATVGGPYSLPPGISAGVSYQCFTAIAVGNIDDDPSLDIWSIDDTKTLIHLSDDNTQ